MKKPGRELIASGIPFTIFRNGWYSDNYTGSIPGALAGGAFIGSAGEGKISSAPRADYADAAVAVLTSEGHAGKTYEFAAEISRQIGKDIPYKNLSESDYAVALASFRLPKSLAQAIAGCDTGASENALYDDSRQLSKLIGRPPPPLSVAFGEALK